MSTPSLFSLFRKNPIRNGLILGTANIALWFTYDYTTTRSIMKIACKKARVYGDEKLKNPLAQPRHITVILNPVACKRKSKKLYTKWVEPILHLAGIKVSLVETVRPNQAYDLMKIMSNCDGVAIVGGDGTVNEAINGLLSRPDCAKAAREFPIGILPAGEYNSIARYLHQNNIHYRNQKEFLMHATMRLVDSVTENFDVLKVTPMDQTIKEKESPIYALRDIRYGLYQSNFFKVSGYAIYQNNIKPYWLRLKRIFSSKFSSPKIKSISYTEPCEGCSRCYEKHLLKNSQSANVEEKQSTNRRWWSMLTPKSSQSSPDEDAKKELELSKKDNPECDRWLRIERISDITDFRASMMGDKMIRLSLGRDSEYEAKDVFETQDVRLEVAPELEDEKKKVLEPRPESEEPMDAKAKQEEKDRRTHFLVDGQPNQAHSIEITTLRKAIVVFTGPFTKAGLPQTEIIRD